RTLFRLIIPSSYPLFLRHARPGPRPPPSFPTRRSSDLDLLSLHDHTRLLGVPGQSQGPHPKVLLDGLLQRAVVLGRCHIVRWCADRKSTRLNSSHVSISYAVFCLKKKKSTVRIHFQTAQ